MHTHENKVIRNQVRVVACSHKFAEGLEENTELFIEVHFFMAFL